MTQISIGILWFAFVAVTAYVAQVAATWLAPGLFQ